MDKQTKEVRLANNPNCWICVDVGRTRAINPTHLSVMHGSPLKVIYEYFSKFDNDNLILRILLLNRI